MNMGPTSKVLFIFWLNLDENICYTLKVIVSTRFIMDKVSLKY